MLKHISKLSFKINEREYLILCDQDSPTSELKELACTLIKIMCEIEDRARMQAKPEVPTDLPAMGSNIEKLPEEEKQA
jgi:hypothetical protein